MEQLNYKDNLSPGFESVGQILKYYRRLKNFSLEEVSKRTYIKEKYLYALEENIIDIMPSSVYACSYVKQYSKLLGLDGKELVKLYKKQFNLVESDSIVSNGNENSLGSLEKEKTMGNNETIIDIKENKTTVTADLEPLKEDIKEASIDLKSSTNKALVQNNVSKSNGNGNGNGNGKHTNNEPAKATLVTTNNNPTNNVSTGNIVTKKDEKPSKEVSDSIDQAERIIDQAKKDGDKYVRESKEYSRQVKSEANQYLKQVKAYADYLLIAVERELTVILEEIQTGRDILKTPQK